MNEKHSLSFVEILFKKLSNNLNIEEEEHDSNIAKNIPVMPEKLTDDEKVELIIHKNNFKKSMNYTDFEKAINYQSIVLALTLKQWGTKHMRTVDAKCTLAKAYLSNREPCIAQRIYSEALRAVTLYFPNAKATHDEIREHVARCADAERLSVGITQLASYMGLTRVRHQLT
jgi:hypothetical protein